jgi:hypothetical protein
MAASGGMTGERVRVQQIDSLIVGPRLTAGTGGTVRHAAVA